MIDLLKRRNSDMTQALSRRKLIWLAAISCLMACAGSSVAQIGTSVSYPANAPKIASDFRSTNGVNKRPRGYEHQGIDIIGPNKQEIIAAADGRVLEVESGPCWGPTIVVDHGAGKDGKPLLALYGHLGTAAVTANQTVKRGQVIGHLGNNYDEFKCIAGVRHLHFQIGRSWRGPEKGSYWGHLRFLVDGNRAANPHDYWSDGRGKVTCFAPDRTYPEGTLTYPLPCDR